MSGQEDAESDLGDILLVGNLGRLLIYDDDGFIKGVQELQLAGIFHGV